MTQRFQLHDSIRLEGVPSAAAKSQRIAAADAERQARTAEAILQRLHEQPGVVLADEVGMGKTFVALAVATSITLGDPDRRPVVVMVPPSLIDKWPRDFSYFATRCLDPNLASGVRCRSAATGVELLKLLDDKIDAPNRASIIFMTHGAMNRGLTDGWVKLAVIQRALKYRRDTAAIRRSLSRCAGELLRMQWVEKAGEDIWERLLDTPTKEWRGVLSKLGIDPEGDQDATTEDDPVPESVIEILESPDAANVCGLQAIFGRLQEIPQRATSTWGERIGTARTALKEPLRNVWSQCLKRLSFKLPLLILDEAHHLKNADTNLAKLFRTADGATMADELERGALAGVFERMLFLTATPFQLGHAELCSVLERFQGIDWTHPPASGGKEKFQQRLEELQTRLDTAQAATLRLESTWGGLKPHDLIVNGELTADVEEWWRAVANGAASSSIAGDLQKRFHEASNAMRTAEEALRPFVVRHLRQREFQGKPRRERLPGASILTDSNSVGDRGIEVSGQALLPFLLAARATTCEPEKRPVFAEGLASSYEAFRHTQTDDDDDPTAPPNGETPNSSVSAGSMKWYLARLKDSLPSDQDAASAAHPKIAATAQQVLKAWRDGEKVLVFCHFLATGRTLRRVISGKLHEEILHIARDKMGCKPHEVEAQLAQRSGLFRRSGGDDSPARLAVDAKVAELLNDFQELHDLKDDLHRVCRRFIRTPSFLVRYFPLEHNRFNADVIEQAFSADFGTGLSLGEMLKGFFRFLAEDCAGKAATESNGSRSGVVDERRSYLDAILKTQTGAIHGDEAHHSYSADEKKLTATERLLPNVRLVNGPTEAQTRQRLMLTFNSPFFPEVLIASSVMAEGVDLHRFCRYVIHHDLSWNPSTLEQRTGRVDRIGAKVEQCGQPIRVYLPYLGETQDEKQYRVVMDRERWFSVVMGEHFRTDARSTDRDAERVPFPESLASQLAFRLEANTTTSQVSAVRDSDSNRPETD